MLNASTWKTAMKSKFSTKLKAVYAQMHSADESKDDNWFADQMAELLADIISSTGTDQIKTAGIPAGTVITAVSGGSGAPAVGAPNTAEIKVT